MIYRVRHLTTYTYAEPVLLAHHQAHMTPRNFDGQTCRRSAIRVTPLPAHIDDHGHDYFGNQVSFFTLQDPHKTLAVEVVSRVEVKPRDLPSPGETPPWESVVDILASEYGPTVLEASEYRFDSPFISTTDPEILAYAKLSFPPEMPVLAGLLDLTSRIFKEFKYDPKATTVATPLRQVLKDKRGVCQDFAHLEIACLRSLGLAARYVSG